MKAGRVVLMAVALLLVAGCTDDVSTGPRGPEAPRYRPTPGISDDGGYSFAADGSQWTIRISPSDDSVTRTSIFKDGLPYAVFDGATDAAIDDVVSAEVYEGGALALASEMVLGPPPVSSTQNMMALDIPCQSELEAFIGSTLVLSYALYRARYFRGSFGAVVSAAAAVLYSARELHQCIQRVQRQPL